MADIKSHCSPKVHLLITRSHLVGGKHIIGDGFDTHTSSTLNLCSLTRLAMEQQSSNPSHYALLIGINAYSKRDSLRGCVNDVQSIKHVLDKQASPAVHTKILTASVDAAGGIVEEEEDRPTYENVFKALVQTREKATRGDCVYIHYSGHGTRIPPAGKSDEHETNGYDGYLALCLLADGQLGQVKELWGRHLAVQISRMVDKGVAVTVVLDCCFSGTLWRDDEGESIDDDDDDDDDPKVRYRPYKHNINTEQGVETCADVSLYRQVDMTPSWLIKPEGYTIMVACGPHEKAAEFQPKDDTRFFGRLSHCLYEIFLKHGFSNKHRHVYNHLRPKFHHRLMSDTDGTSTSTNTNASKSASHDKQRRKRQTPILYGNKEQSFFGEPPAVRNLGPDHPETATILVEKPNDNDAALVLHAGQAHGLRVGDELRIYPSFRRARGSTSAQSEYLTATIRQAGGLTSILDIRGADAGDYDDWVAELRLSHRLHDFAVYLDPSVPDLATLRETLSRHSMYAHVDRESQPYAFHLIVDKGNVKGMDHFAILDREGQRLNYLPPMSLSRTDVEDVSLILTHLAKYTLVKELQNRSPGSAHNGKQRDNFRASFDVYVTSRSGVRREPEHVLEVQEVEPSRKTFNFQLHFLNKGESTLFAYVYALGPLWDVSHVHFASFDMVPSTAEAEAAAKQGGGERPPHTTAYQPRISKKLRTTVPQGMRSGRLDVVDVVKVFVTARPTTFDMLEQPGIEDMLDRRTNHQYRESQLDELLGTGEWDAFNFPIRTILKH